MALAVSCISGHIYAARPAWKVINSVLFEVNTKLSKVTFSI